MITTSPPCFTLLQFIWTLLLFVSDKPGKVIASGASDPGSTCAVSLLQTTQIKGRADHRLYDDEEDEQEHVASIATSSNAVPSVSLLETHQTTLHKVDVSEVSMNQEQAEAATAAAERQAAQARADAEQAEEAVQTAIAKKEAAVRAAQEAALKAFEEKKLLAKAAREKAQKVFEETIAAEKALSEAETQQSSDKASSAALHVSLSFWKQAFTMDARWPSDATHSPLDASSLPIRSGPQLVCVLAISLTVMLVGWMTFKIRLLWSEGQQLQRHRLAILFISLAATTWATMTINRLLMASIKAPGFVMSLQMLIAVVVAIALAGGRLSFESRHVRRWILVPLVACMQMWTALYTVHHLSRPMLMTARTLAPVPTLLLELVVMPVDTRPAVSPLCVVGLFLVLAFSITTGLGASISWAGCGVAAASASLAIVDNVLRRRLFVSECEDMPTTMCMLLNNIVGIIPSIFFGFLTGELLELDIKASLSPMVVGLLLVSGTLAAGMSYFALCIQREIAATSFSVLESNIRVAEIFAGIACFNDIYLPAQTLGMLISCLGSLLYAGAKMGSQPPRKSKHLLNSALTKTRM